MEDIKLRVESLNVSFPNGKELTRAVQGVSFSLGKEKLAIVGESGSGKSTIGRSLLRLLPRKAIVSADRFDFDGVDILKASERDMRSIRGKRISMILQDPKFSLNPVMRIGDQIAEAYIAHANVGKKVAKERALHMLEKVQIREPGRAYKMFPHEVSGGMGQRAMIAMMMIAEPEIIIADEPTSALDVSVREQVLEVLRELVDRSGIGLIFISHDLNLVRHFCDRVLVMYSGKILEEIEAKRLDEARHPYTRGLLDSLPSLTRRRAHLPTLIRDPAWLA
jgi:peptide/nickel transport system ATP-binding protein